MTSGSLTNIRKLSKCDIRKYNKCDNRKFNKYDIIRKFNNNYQGIQQISTQKIRPASFQREFQRKKTFILKAKISLTYNTYAF